MLVWNIENAAVAAAHSVNPHRWWDGFGEVIDRISGRFSRYEPRRRAARLMLGLVSGLDCKNCWTIAEHRGDATPDGLQHLLARAVWDTDGVRDDLRDYVIDHFGDPGAVLVIDETGDVRKGSHTVGVQRQYTGTARRVENAQVAVFLTYATPRGHALIDRALYLPKSWIADPDRCAAAGVPSDTGFATKPALATAMIKAALAADVPASWVAGLRSTALTPSSGQRSASLVWVTCCRSRPTAGCPHPSARSASMNSPPGCPHARGRRHPPERAAKAKRMYSWAWAAIDAEPSADAEPEAGSASPADPPQRQDRRAGLPPTAATHPARSR